MAICFPASRPLIQTQHPQKAKEDEGEVPVPVCPAYGCPIYAPELTPYLHQLLGEIFIEKNRTNTFEFGTKTMAMLTQTGKSHFYNQDRSVVFEPFLTAATPLDEPSFLVAVFDGHGEEGHIVADHVAKDFPERLAEKLNSLSNSGDISDKSIVQALNETFVEVDVYAPPNFLLGGCTASVTLRRGSKLYIANAGDSQTILVSVKKLPSKEVEPRVEYMTRKDKASIPEEYNRIVGLGGTVFINNKTHDSRVVLYSVAARDTFMLAMSRSLGDWEWKLFGVTAEPLVDVLDLNDYPNAFLIAGSDGIWDVRRREFFAKQFSESFYGGTADPLFKCWDVIKKVTPKAQKGYRDDITAIVMKL
jgi:serine/threonine protein phosphatase PrpC